RVVAPGAILLQHDVVTLEAEHLEYVRRRMTVPRRVTDRHPDRDPLPALDELGRLHAAPFLSVLLKEVDHLLPVVSDWRRAVDAATGDTEPATMVCEQFLERGRV